MGRLVLKQKEGQHHIAPEPGERVIIGIDLSRSKWAYACRQGGQLRRQIATPGRIEHLQALVADYPQNPVEVIYEACGFGYEIAWWGQEKGIPVLVVAPSTIERAPGAQVKTDRRDAADLALRAEKGTLKGIYIPTRAQHQNRQLSRTYEQALKDRRRQQTRLRLLLQEHGHAWQGGKWASWAHYEQWLATLSLPAPVECCVRELVSLRQAAALTVARLQRELRKLARSPEYRGLVRALSKQGGVGRLTAIRFVLELGDIHRFATPGSLPHFLGLTPSEYSTGPVVRRGSIRRCGPKTLRSWIVQCAWQTLRSTNETHLREWFERVAARAGRKRAIVGVARKLCLRLRSRWLEYDNATAAI